MKKNFLKMFIGIMFISLCLIFYVINANSSKHDTTVDLTGNNGVFKAFLNIHFPYDSELLIVAARDDIEMPSEIDIDIIVNNKRVYTDRLKYIPYPIGKSSGKYMVNFSDDYFKRDIKDATIIIKFNDKSSSILLNLNPPLH